MAYLTFDYAQERSGTFKKALEKRALFEGRDYLVNKVFLSHRHKDIEQVKIAVGFLLDEGADVYVDYLDNVLPNKTSSETAKILRNRVNACSKFILLATPNSLDSKWIPWELGLGDRKGTENVAILPFLNSETSWTEREYYSLYHYIERTNQGVWGVFPPQGGNGVRLSNWLKQ